MSEGVADILDAVGIVCAILGKARADVKRRKAKLAIVFGHGVSKSVGLRFGLF